MDFRRTTALRLVDVLLTAALCVAVIFGFLLSAAIAAALIDNWDQCNAAAPCSPTAEIIGLTVLIIGEILAFALGVFLSAGAALRGRLVFPRAALGAMAMAAVWPITAWIAG